MAQSTQNPGPEDPAITKLFSSHYLILLHSADRSCSAPYSKPQETGASLSSINTPLPSPDRNALATTRKRSMSFLRSKDTNKSATILHAVPETQCLPAVQADQDVSSRSRLLSANHTSPSLSCNTASPRVQSSNPSPVLSNKSSQVDDLKSVFSNRSLKGAIGIYKHGKIQWRHKENAPSASDTRNICGADTSSRPSIQVVIPRDNRNRPLPATPFFTSPTRNHIVTASIENDYAHTVSPPSATNKVTMRDSVVSPLNHTQPVPFGQFQRSMSRIVRKPSARAPHKRHPISKPSGSSVDSHDSDSASTYSTGSSDTSLEPDSPPLSFKHARHYSVQNPVVAGVFDSSPESYVKRIPTLLVSRPRQYAHHPSLEQDRPFRPTCLVHGTRKATNTLSRQSTISRKSSRGSRRRSLVTTNGVIDRAISRSASRQASNPHSIPSPTLSEAENELEEHLTSLKEDAKSTAKVENRPNRVDMTATPPPVLPRKSSKRQSIVNEAYWPSHSPPEYAVPRMNNMHNMRQHSRSPRLTITIPENKRMVESFEVAPVPVPVPAKHIKRNITPKCAEGVILGIFRSLDHFDDLFATAVVNHGFLRVFKRYELELIKTTLAKMSPPAWEFREYAFPGHDMLHDEDLEMTRPQEEYTPMTYLQLQKRDTQTIRAIKSLIKEKCQSFVRPEISIALISEDPAQTGRVDDALWRIWTFCKIFGSGKGREEDIIAQQDWLKGGIMVHQPTCTFSIVSTDYMNDTLIGAPECFGKGNEGGLTAEELFDMMELWNCLGVLLQGFEGRTAQAREHGIYDNTEIRGGDIDGEESMLDEWCYYLLTFGLSTVLDLAGQSYQANGNPFKAAAQQGWTNWTPPVFGGSRRNFLKEAASRVYEDKIARTYATTTTRDIQRQLSKQRVEKHIIELRNLKTNGLQLPMIRMSQERPMSEWSTVIGSLNREPPAESNNIVSHVPTLRSALAQDLAASAVELPTCRTPEPTHSRSSSPRRTTAQPLLPTPPPSTVPSSRDRNSIAMSMPSIEEHPAYRQQKLDIPAVPSIHNHPAFRHRNPVTAPLEESISSNHNHSHSKSSSHACSHSRGSSGHSTASTERSHPVFQQHATQHGIYASAAHENTAEKAIYRIVEMGFTPEQAREALRMTDLGDGLRVDRAVELLLSRGH
ncbi:hypothetical protein DE146DRAFT_632368 [Phaeosphaeria sp. MPI-PUGE-AT-0046c]|nr:hypothetical protein DE146DRAFT_632368 [Phaeosphaeria sp. MPI-PUGE-AT-0046c]